MPAAVSRLDPRCRVLSDTRRPMRDAREAAELAKQLPMAGAGARDPDDPDVAAVLADFIRRLREQMARRAHPGAERTHPVDRGVLHPDARQIFRVRTGDDPFGREISFHRHQTDAFEVDRQRRQRLAAPCRYSGRRRTAAPWLSAA